MTRALREECNTPCTLHTDSGQRICGEEVRRTSQAYLLCRPETDELMTAPRDAQTYRCRDNSDEVDD